MIGDIFKKTVPVRIQLSPRVNYMIQQNRRKEEEMEIGRASARAVLVSCAEGSIGVERFLLLALRFR